MTTHWTENSPQKFAYRVASDFTEQVRAALKAKKWSQNKFAKKLGLTPGRVSQILNNPGNLTLETMALWARKLGGKVVVSYYEDGDSRNQRGPINGEVFRLCWVKAGRPANAWLIRESAQPAPSAPGWLYQIPKGHHGDRPAGQSIAARSASGVPSIRGFDNPNLVLSSGDFTTKAPLNPSVPRADVPS